MSNIIKAYTVRYNDDMKTIDSNSSEKKKVFYSSKDNIVLNDESQDIDFVGGLQAVVVDSTSSDDETCGFKASDFITEGCIDESKIDSKIENIIDDAKKQATKIIDKARSEGEQIKNEIMAHAQEKGYEEGLDKGKLEIQKQVEELRAKSKDQDEKYEALLSDIEPKMVRIMSALIEKITGILVEDKQDVILYLVEKALKNIEKVDEITICVSHDDYELLSSRKENLLSSIGEHISLNILEDNQLHKNQCRIETDIHVIDCSLDVQLKKLTNSLRLMCSV